MDNPHYRPRLSTYRHAFAQPALSTNTQASVPAIVDTPVMPQQSEPAPVVDFAAQAKAYKRKHIKQSLLKSVFVFGCVVLVVLILIAALGYYLNQRYAGRALPYTYIGSISIGGLTQPQIKAALDAKAEDLQVTFTEGGLTRTVPVNELGAEFNTQKASEQAITGFNPFSYLTKRTLTVPVDVNERYVDGYIRMHVATMQTDAKNAEITKAKKELVIVPETNGFRTSTAYVVEQLQKSLATLEPVTIKLSAVTDKPSITQADLQDDIETARKLIATNVGIKAYNTVIRPTEEQKLSWLDIKAIPGSSEVNVGYSETKIREYVFEIAKKYHTAPVAEQAITNPDGTQAVQPGKNGSVVANIDEVANTLYQSLVNQRAEVIAFTINPVEYQKLSQPTALSAPTTQTASTQTQAPATTSNQVATPIANTN